MTTYQHYKNPKHLYQLICYAKDSETLEDVVVYQALYNSKEHGDNTIWVRPKKMFFEKVLVNGQKIPRFTPINNNNK